MLECLSSVQAMVPLECGRAPRWIARHDISQKASLRSVSLNACKEPASMPRTGKKVGAHRNLPRTRLPSARLTEDMHRTTLQPKRRRGHPNQKAKQHFFEGCMSDRNRHILRATTTGPDTAR